MSASSSSGGHGSAEGFFKASIAGIESQAAERGGMSASEEAYKEQLERSLKAAQAGIGFPYVKAA